MDATANYPENKTARNPDEVFGSDSIARPTPEQYSEDFFSSLSHELKTPLAIILAFNDILLRARSDELSQLQRDQLRIMQRNGRRLEYLIADVLDVARLNNGTLELSISEFNAAEMLRAVSSADDHSSADGEHEIIIDLSDEPIWLKADRERLSRALGKLIHCVRSSSSGVTAHSIVAIVDEGCLIIGISQDRDLISAPELKKLHSLAYGVVANQPPPPVADIFGLSMVKGVVELHGGRFVIDQNPSRPTFRLMIPGVLPGPSPVPRRSESTSGLPLHARSRLLQHPNRSV